LVRADGVVVVGELGQEFATIKEATAWMKEWATAWIRQAEPNQ
jgi:hypothetical protein